MNNVILGIVAIFFVIGAIDYINNNKFGLGKIFEEGISNMGSLAISMVGILSLTPIVGELINKYIIPVSERLNIDPSIFSSSILAIDMGALNIAEQVSTTPEMKIFSGVLMGSMVGCTISFTLPLALGMVKEENRTYLCKGILCGIATLPIGLFIGGIILKISIIELILNLIPILIISTILVIGLIYKQDKTVDIFNILSKGILYISLLGFIIQGIQSILGVKIIDNMMPLEESILIVGKIAIFLGGAYVMLEWIKRTFSKNFSILEKKFNVNGETIAAFVGSLASAIVVFTSFDKLDDRGKIMCSAFSVGGAYVIGGQLGFVASEAPEFLSVYILTKLVSGILAVIFSLYLINRENKKEPLNNI